MSYLERQMLSELLGTYFYNVLCRGASQHLPTFFKHCGAHCMRVCPRKEAPLQLSLNNYNVQLYCTLRYDFQNCYFVLIFKNVSLFWFFIIVTLFWFSKMFLCFDFQKCFFVMIFKIVTCCFDFPLF